MKVIYLLKKIENGENIPKKIKVYQEVEVKELKEEMYNENDNL